MGITSYRVTSQAVKTKKMAHKYTAEWNCDDECRVSSKTLNTVIEKKNRKKKKKIVQLLNFRWPQSFDRQATFHESTCIVEKVLVVFEVANACRCCRGPPQLCQKPLLNPGAEVAIWLSKPRDHRTGWERIPVQKLSGNKTINIQINIT